MDFLAKGGVFFFLKKTFKPVKRENAKLPEAQLGGEEDEDPIGHGEESGIFGAQSGHVTCPLPSEGLAEVAGGGWRFCCFFSNSIDNHFRFHGYFGMNYSNNWFCSFLLG